MGRPKRTDTYRPATVNITATADDLIDYVRGNSRAVGLHRCSSRGDAVCLCVEQVAAMMKRQQVTGELIPWEIPKDD